MPVHVELWKKGKEVAAEWGYSLLAGKPDVGKLVEGSTELTLVAAAAISRATGERIARTAVDMGPEAFANEWKWARLAISLQARLAAEQGLWDLGGDYRRLISGFAPIGKAQRATRREERVVQDTVARRAAAAENIKRRRIQRGRERKLAERRRF